MWRKQTNWERIEAVIKWANMSTNYFARYIGLPRGENLYQIKRGNNGISLDVAERIVEKFPQIDKLWLLTGDGQMFSECRLRGVQIPLYNIDVERGLPQIKNLDANLSVVVPPLSDCDMAMYYTGRAMGEIIPAGSMILLKAVSREEIIPGGEYVVQSRKFVALRIVRFTDDPAKIRLVAGDKVNYDDILVDLNDVSAVYKVKGKLIINN